MSLQQHNPQNYTIGRGRVSVNGRYIGSTSRAGFVFSNGLYYFRFATESITVENLKMFFGGPFDGTITYEAENGVGENTHLHLDCHEIRPEEHELKTPHWQQLAFIAEIITDSDGVAAVEFSSSEE